MNGLPYYKAYPRDFIEGTIGMPFEVKCAYRVILDLIYMQGGNLPDDARYISGLLGCSIRKWNSLRQAMIDLGKLQVSGEFLTNYRAVSELETLSKLQNKQSENARGSRKNKHLEKPRQNHTEPEPDKKKEPNGSLQKKGSRLPSDWVLPKALGEWAVENGLSRDEVRREAETFKDYWIGVPGQKGIKLDWPATWRNWIRKRIKDDPRRQASNQSFWFDGEVHR